MEEATSRSEGAKILAVRSSQTAFVTGVPSPEAYYVNFLVSECLRRAYGEVDAVALNDASESTLNRWSGGSQNKVFFSDLPDADVVELILRSSAPLIFVTVDLCTATRQFMTARGISARDAVLAIFDCYAAVAPLQTDPRAVVVSIKKFATALDLAKFLGHAVGIEREPWNRIEALFRDECDLSRSVESALSEFSSRIGKTERFETAEDEFILRELSDSITSKSDGSLHSFRIPLSLILGGEPPYLPAHRPIELTGPARMLTFGPYIALPSGEWQVRFEFESLDNQASNSFTFDVFVEGIAITEWSIELIDNGRYAASVPFRLEQRGRLIEFRTHLRAGAIYGQFRLISVEVAWQTSLLTSRLT